jgi:hypothetical protein
VDGRCLGAARRAGLQWRSAGEFLEGRASTLGPAGGRRYARPQASLAGARDAGRAFARQEEQNARTITELVSTFKSSLRRECGACGERQRSRLSGRAQRRPACRAEGAAYNGRVRRLLAGLVVLIVASTPAADAYCRAVCVGAAIETAGGDGHCTLHQASPAGPLMAAADGPCANPHADARLQQTVSKIERVAKGALPFVPAPRASSPIDTRIALEFSLARLTQQPLAQRSLPLRR